LPAIMYQIRSKKTANKQIRRGTFCRVAMLKYRHA
jgi:hypothetical protein